MDKLKHSFRFKYQPAKVWDDSSLDTSQLTFARTTVNLCKYLQPFGAVQNSSRSN